MSKPPRVIRERPTRREKRADAERSEALAAELMELTVSDVKALDLDEDIREQIEDARAHTANTAKRREKRRFGRWLLNFADLDDLTAQIKTKREASAQNTRAFKNAETWRAKLIEAPETAAAFVEAHPEVAAKALAAAIADAQHETATGKPRGAKKKLFRMVRDALMAAAVAAERAAVAANKAAKGDDE